MILNRARIRFVFAGATAFLLPGLIMSGGVLLLPNQAFPLLTDDVDFRLLLVVWATTCVVSIPFAVVEQIGPNAAREQFVDHAACDQHGRSVRLPVEIVEESGELRQMRMRGGQFSRRAAARQLHSVIWIKAPSGRSDFSTLNKRNASRSFTGVERRRSHSL